MQDQISQNGLNDYYDNDCLPKRRNRSKSSSAIFGDFDPELQPEIPDFSSIWGDSSMHKRSSTQPHQLHQNVVWEALKAAQLATPQDMNGQDIDKLMVEFKKEQVAFSPRRFSVAPSMVNKFMTKKEDYDLGKRRHSTSGGQVEQDFDKLDINNSNIDDYFENSVDRKKALKDAGKNLQQQQQQQHVQFATSSNDDEGEHEWPVYVVEFKAGRTDYFYLPKSLSKITIKNGDLLIVEADRGQDLGKVIECNLNSRQQLRDYQSTHVDPLVDSHNAIGKEITPKKIYRKAEKSEAQMLLIKSQDELAANTLCQSKVKQRKLPMQVVDAEYQWDRRKLTFYFVADKRVDFRELVRELFKLYKTRIWMYNSINYRCAVNPS